MPRQRPISRPDRRAPRRRVTLLLICGAASLGACSGGGSDNTPVTPPPSSQQATALAVAGGDNQQAEAGSAVATAPTVRALNASQQGVAGVQVTFTVDAGGGAITNAQAITGADGTASAGQWTLGNSAGPNTLRASATGLVPVTIHAIATPRPLRGAEATIGPAGGSITVTQPGQVGDGFRITVPAGVLTADVQVTVEVDTTQHIALPNGVTVAGPVFRVSGFPATAANAFLSIRLPVARGGDTVVAAFLRDPSTGRLELLPATERTATTYTAVTRHLSPVLMLRPPSLASRRVAAPAIVATTIDIMALQAAELLIANGAESGFRPGTDDWEFTNMGSWLESGGHCAGQSISAIWYYLARKGIDGPLFDRFNVIDGIDQDDRDGYRFASVVQNVLNWRQLDRIFYLATGTSIASTFPLDKLHFTASVLSMLTTGEPQLITLQNDVGGHAVIAFRADQHHLYIADPNYPGQTRVIDFDGTYYTPFPAQPRATAPEELYSRIRGVGITELVAAASLDALWPSVLLSTIGNGKFPALQYQYYDLLADQWLTLPGTLTTRQDRLRVRSICPDCGQGLATAPGTTPPDYVQWLTAWDMTGAVIGDGYTPAGQTSEGSTFPLTQGTQRVGLYTQADTPENVWSFVDWTWLTVNAVPFAVEPDDARVAIGTTQSLVARPFGVHPASARYVWDFNDGTAPVTRMDDSTVQHQFTTAGLRTVTVEMWDHPAARRVARAESTIEVGDSVTTWVFDELKGTIPAWNPIDVQTAADYSRHELFFTAIKNAPATGRLDLIEPPGKPQNGSLRVIVNPSPTSITTLILGARNLFCGHQGELVLEGTTTNGTLTGKGRVNNCLIGPPGGANVLATTFEFEGTIAGRNMAGTIKAHYQDFTKSGNNHIPAGSVNVTYTFKAHRP